MPRHLAGLDRRPDISPEEHPAQGPSHAVAPRHLHLPLEHSIRAIPCKFPPTRFSISIDSFVIRQLEASISVYDCVYTLLFRKPIHVHTHVENDARVFSAWNGILVRLIINVLFVE